MLALKTAICKWHTSFMFPFTWVKQVILLGLTSTRQGRAILPKFHRRIEILVNKQEIFQTLILQETCILQLIPNNDIHQRLGNIYLPQLNAGLSSQALNQGRFLFGSYNKQKTRRFPSPPQGYATIPDTCKAMAIGRGTLYVVRQLGDSGRVTEEWALCKALKQGR